MSNFMKTMNLLAQAGIPTRMVDPATVTYFLDKGYSPEWIAAQIYSVKERAS